MQHLCQIRIGDPRYLIGVVEFLASSTAIITSLSYGDMKPILKQLGHGWTTYSPFAVIIE